MNKLLEGKKVFEIEIEALNRTKDALDETFVAILDLITSCKGKVIVTGMGKPGHRPQWRSWWRPRSGKARSRSGSSMEESPICSG